MIPKPPLSLSLLMLLLLGGIPATPSGALQGSDGTIYFAQVPRLINASATRKRANATGSTLKFTVTVPAEAGEPLAQIDLTQDQNFEALRIPPDRISATLGSEWSLEAPKLPIQVQVPSTRERQPIQVSFDPPIAPGNTVTLGLRPPRTPRSSGVYQFGVVALPAGQKPHDYFLGYGRITFFDGNDDDLFVPFG